MTSQNPNTANVDPGWAARADVIYHFYAYHRFAPSSDGLDLINLSDTDIQFYNQTAIQTLTPETQLNLATYLKERSDTEFRKALILHVQSYNKTIPARQRIYMLGLTSEDLQILNPDLKVSGKVTANKGLTFASAGMTGDGFRHICEKKEGVKEGEEVAVEEAVEICLRYFEDNETEREIVEKTGGLEVGGEGSSAGH